MNTLLSELQSTIGRLARDVGPAVVGVGRLGTGVVVAKGAVLTNAHNLRRDEVAVTFADGRREDGVVAGIDVDGDLAVVSAETGATEPVARAPELPGLGAAVFALANPGGRGLHVGFGLVTGLGRSFRGPRGRRISPTVEHDAALPRGSSGGPLVDAEGRLLGINTLRLEGGLISAIGVDAAMRERVEALGRGESPRRVTLGLALAPSHAARRLRRAVGLPERDGLLVRGVRDGSAAADAGLEPGDLLVAANGSPLTDVDDLLAAVDAGGRELELTVIRVDEERRVTVALEAA